LPLEYLPENEQEERKKQIDNEKRDAEERKADEEIWEGKYVAISMDNDSSATIEQVRLLLSTLMFNLDLVRTYHKLINILGKMDDVTLILLLREVKKLEKTVSQVYDSISEEPDKAIAKINPHVQLFYDSFKKVFYPGYYVVKGKLYPNLRAFYDELQPAPKAIYGDEAFLKLREEKIISTIEQFIKTEKVNNETRKQNPEYKNQYRQLTMNDYFMLAEDVRIINAIDEAVTEYKDLKKQKKDR